MTFLERRNVNPCYVSLFRNDLILILALCVFYWKDLILIHILWCFFVFLEGVNGNLCSVWLFWKSLILLLVSYSFFFWKGLILIRVLCGFSGRT